jgi:hypothetical protein
MWLAALNQPTRRSILNLRGDSRSYRKNFIHFEWHPSEDHCVARWWRDICSRGRYFTIFDSTCVDFRGRQGDDESDGMKQGKTRVGSTGEPFRVQSRGDKNPIILATSCGQFKL